MKVLMIGYNASLLKSISESDFKFDIIVLEEEELYVNKKLQNKNFRCLKEVIFSEYQQSKNYLKIVDKLKRMDFDSIIPGLEYAVTATNDIAKELGLPFAGDGVEHFLTNKIMLRNHCNKNIIKQPRYKKVNSRSDIEKFFDVKPIVLKPANRQASLGVIKIHKREEIPKAWKEVTNLIEKNQNASRIMEWEYLVEDYMEGVEISSEVFVKNGEILFVNNTEKIVSEGRYSVELAHIIPARIEESTNQKILDYVEKLVKSFKFENGILHFEIMITRDGPKIIEVAGRPPGDMIFKLIEHSYGFNPYKEFIEILSKKRVKNLFPKKHNKGTCIYFLDPKIRGVWNGEIDDFLLKDSGILEWSMYLKPGEIIREIKSSWDRVGYVLTTGVDSNEAYLKAVKLNEKVFISKG
ncbi:ATP-grasp domain-containing protein [Sporosarcina sp. resist]|uniref:ATP-grasp domain-containing protein n=1 Tax=Sporosarcina sp. resist TaxID=2762563 RepID=UPI00164D33F6|nr:ATP-grasp domain-containing protein [Sporosarcina sp. resist]QNK89107.1 ATP-grasp domain-containing protein [Sporosarcina sp. resist]